MTDITATEAARSLSSLLDAVEHRGARFTVSRRGKAIARIEPVAVTKGRELKDLLARFEPDGDWAAQLDEVRGLLQLDVPR